MKIRIIKSKFIGCFLLNIILLTALNAKNNTGSKSSAKPLAQLQQEFLDLRFGMLLCFGSSNYSGHDWADPNFDPKLVNPTKINCNQWADAAASAGMTYGCITTKHHSGFSIWNTKTTDYCIMNSPGKHDVVKEFADAFRKKGLKVFLYYSILDIHHNIRPGFIDKSKVDFIKAQLTELLTNYGEIGCLLIDGWDSPWSRISYDDISFEEIHKLVKKLQPNCLISEHNAAKYPAEYLFYSDIKHYEQNAGQLISRESNKLPAQAGIPININWFWKKTSPQEVVKDAEFIVRKNLIPLNQAHCNFLLSVTPNPNGLLDENAVAELKKIGRIWKNEGAAPKLTTFQKPIVASNLAKKQKTNSSWSEDIFISDFANDDDFKTFWRPSSFVKEPYLEILFGESTPINSIGFVESDYDNPLTFTSKLKSYDIQYWNGSNWQSLRLKNESERVRIYRFNPIKTSKVRLQVKSYLPELSIAELMVYNEK